MTSSMMSRPGQAADPSRRPLWVSVEGINGVGKTSAVQATAVSLGSRCLRLSEVTDQAAGTLTGQVISALSADGDACLRTGHPVAETLALLALKVREAELLSPEHVAGVDVILEDRGLDSVAVCQGAILHIQHRRTPARAVAGRILAASRRWRPVADATILLTGDPKVCTARFAARIGRALTASELEVIELAGRLYFYLAAAEPERFTVIDVTGHSRDDTAMAVKTAVHTFMTQREPHHAS